MVLSDIHIAIHIVVLSCLTVPEVFTTWLDQIPIPQRNCKELIAWHIIPKCVLWAFWLARNDLLFNDRTWTPVNVANKAKLQILETVMQWISSIPPAMSEWLGCILSSNLCGSRKTFFPKPTMPPPWRLRLSADTFSHWWKSKGAFTIFFDGASKGNLGVAGVGGLIYSLDKEFFFSFCWGLGICSNN